MEEKKSFSKAEKRWIVREIKAGRMSLGEAREMVSGVSTNPAELINKWQRRYNSELVLTLPVMTDKEKLRLEQAHQHINKLEKALEDAQMKNVALETMIDLAEETFKIAIRKKPGPKQ